jgi:hypothetical protein
MLTGMAPHDVAEERPAGHDEAEAVAGTAVVAHDIMLEHIQHEQLVLLTVGKSSEGSSISRRIILRIVEVSGSR